MYVVYIIQGSVETKRSERSVRTYVGCTNNLERRLRQHNGEIVGGAKHTRKGRPWNIVCYFHGFESQKDALSFEWHLAHRPPSYKCIMRYSIDSRRKDIARVLEKWALKHNRKIEIETDYPDLQNVWDDILVKLIRVVDEVLK